jgi:hypothetical protein
MKIPKELKDIKLKQLELIADIDENVTTQERRLKEIAILCNMDYDELYYSKDIKTVTNAMNDLKWFYQLTTDDINQDVFEFNVNNINYKLIKEMNELSFGQWVDLDYYISDNQENYWTMTKYIMALCSSINGVDHSYPSTSNELSERVSIIENLSLDIVYGYTSYFLKKKDRLKELSQVYSMLNSQNQNGQVIGNPTIKNGDGPQWYMTLLMEMFLGLMMLIGWTYIHVYLPCQSRMKEVSLKVKSILRLKQNTNLNKTL